MNIATIKHILESAGVAAGVVFLQQLEALGSADFGTEPWWPIIAAVLTFGIRILGKAENDQKP